MAKAPQGQSAIERLKEIDEERSGLLESVKTEALDKANEAVSALNDLGFSYQLVEGQDESRRRSRGGAGGRKGRRQVSTERPCPICGFQTEPPHDARRHRGQSEKRPFSAEELEANNMRRVG